MKTLYTTRVTVEGGRDGHARSADGRLDVAMALPTALGGSGAGSNPEQLFAAGFAGCFASSIAYVARQRGLTVGPVSVVGEVDLGISEDGRYGLAARVTVSAPGLLEAERDAVLSEARRICAYSNATRGSIDVTYDFA
ncbi:MAG: Ohr family peroxiredoxin [Hyphomicrobiaceae bacterium]|nr:Ohr family peroxiredoxin [Hyphomicrobiaceae bacterium]